jgi:mannose-6-phosphate isomerase-like protein (cupin superfamily)
MSTTNPRPLPVPLVVKPQEGRTAHPLRIGGQEVLVTVAGADTNDQLSCFFHVVPPMSGPPLHQHTREDEVFYVLEGDVTLSN